MAYKFFKLYQPFKTLTCSWFDDNDFCYYSKTTNVNGLVIREKTCGKTINYNKLFCTIYITYYPNDNKIFTISMYNSSMRRISKVGIPSRIYFNENGEITKQLYYDKNDHVNHFLLRIYKNGVMIYEENKIPTKNYKSIIVEFNDIGNVVSVKTLTSRCQTCPNSNDKNIPSKVNFDNNNNITYQRYSTTCSKINEENFKD